MPAELNVHVQVEQLVDSLHDWLPIDGLPSTEDGFDRVAFARITFPVFRYMLGARPSVPWSVKKIIDDSSAIGFDAGLKEEVFEKTINALVFELEESGVIDRGGAGATRSTEFFLYANSAPAYKYLAELAESAGEDPRFVERILRDEETFRRKEK